MTDLIGRSERAARKRRIDPKLAAAGWQVVPYDPSKPLIACDRLALEEYPTDDGPADYALTVGGRVLGIVEAKKLSLGPQNALTQAERYSRGATSNPFDFRGFHVPFLYSTNGEVLWFHDVRQPLNRSRRITGFHTLDALAELLAHDFDAALARLAALPNGNERLRPYQKEANAAIEAAMTARKRLMLVAMATGTGKTFMTVNETFRLLKSGVARRILVIVQKGRQIGGQELESR